MKKSFT